MSIDAGLILTVREALRRPLFRDARLVAGARGLDRPIRWVHILEIPQVEKLIHGDEMILTTGLGFRLDAETSVLFMEKLIAHNASCLCIEIGPYFERVSPELTELADRHGFPLIVFQSAVRYVDVTQDLHGLIINRHHRTLQELESLSREFYRLTLSAQGTANVLKLLHKSTRNPVALLPAQGAPTFFPPPSASQQEDWLRALGGAATADGGLPETLELGGRTLATRPVGALEQTWAHLVMSCPRKPLQFEYLLLESASLSIAQELLRTRYIEERKLFSENLWVEELVGGRLTEERQLQDLTGSDYPSWNELGHRVCVIEFSGLPISPDSAAGRGDGERESFRLQLSLIARSAFEKHGFRSLLTMKNDRLTAIALDLKAKTPSAARLRQALASLQDSRAADERLASVRLLVGVGRPHQRLGLAATGYHEALQALSLADGQDGSILFFEELGVYQLLIGLNDGKTLQDFIRRYLGPLIDHDRAKGSELLLTLKVFLDHDGSKQIAAQKLFIVRQSLYYRLEKIAELLGEDFMSADNRISIQVALRACQLLEPGRFASGGGSGNR
ncbi:PucR family transcriptional regulator [Cohnella suwonensis]|uniref:PucR family transcriptional regulator n=1 Tax=Cohnella suwonensis TaxID=696072 RepID=A0ABW0LWK5_9BACL